jgi:vanillate O-demethylase monooxygenase subunit
VDDGLFAQQVLGERIVFFRKSDGNVAALEDLCPHRFLPLSKGRRCGDAIECGYHGLVFEADGRCSRIPGQPVVPSSAKVRSYPTGESMGLIWIWMGEPPMADPSRLYRLPQYDDHRWRAVHGGSLPNRANYLSLCDNLLDPSHVTYVHKTTLATPGVKDVPVTVEATAEEIVVWRWLLDSPPIPVFEKTGLFKGNVDRWHYYHFTPPSSCVIDFGTADVGAVTKETRHTAPQIYACHFITPVDDRNCVDHWLHVRNFSIDDVAVDAQLTADLAGAFLEDKAILEAIQIEADRWPDRSQLKIGVDTGPVRMRRMLDKLIDGERKRENAA